MQDLLDFFGNSIDYIITKLIMENDINLKSSFKTNITAKYFEDSLMNYYKKYNDENNCFSLLCFYFFLALIYVRKCGCLLEWIGSNKNIFFPLLNIGFYSSIMWFSKLKIIADNSVDSRFTDMFR